MRKKEHPQLDVLMYHHILRNGINKNKCMRLSNENGYSKLGVGFAPVSSFILIFDSNSKRKLNLRRHY